MRSSKSIGTLVPYNPARVYKEVDGEKFYLVKVLIDGIELPGIISEYLFTKEAKYEFSFYIRCEETDGKLFTFINILAIDEVDPSTPDLNHVEIYGNISKTFPMKVTLEDSTQMRLVGVRYHSTDKNVNIAHCIGYGSLARRLNTMSVGDNVLFVGKMKSRTSIEVEIDLIPVYNPKREVVGLPK